MANKRTAINAETNRKCNIPMYIIIQMGYPTVCNDFTMALDKAREISEKPYNHDDEIRIFDTLTGNFTATYKNGRLQK